MTLNSATDFGLRIYTTRQFGSDQCYLRITNFIFPNAGAFGGSTIGEGYSVHWHVPIDDASHWKYIFMFSRERPISKELRNWSRFELTSDYTLTRNKANRFQQDRESMKTKTFTGMGMNFQAPNVAQKLFGYADAWGTAGDGLEGIAS